MKLHETSVKLHEVSLKFHVKFQVVKLPTPSGVLLVPFFFLLVTLARTGKGLEDDGLSGRGREVA